METLDRFRGCLVGLAVGDAVGTTLEFKPKGSFIPITDMVGVFSPENGPMTPRWLCAWQPACCNAGDLMLRIRCNATAAGAMKAT